MTRTPLLHYKPDITPHRRPGLSRRMRRLGSAAGFVLIALGASTTIFSATTSWASGSTVRSDTMAVAQNAFDYPRSFDAAVETALSTLRRSDPAASGSADRFYTAYTSASQDFSTALTSAAQLYAQAASTDPAAAKAAYIQNFDSARTAYFSALDSARNGVYTDLSGQDNAARDAFINSINAARDHFNTQLESIKNDIASLPA